MSDSGGRMGTAKLPDFDSFWDYDHPGLTEKKFRELLPAAVDSLDISYLAELLTQIARAEVMQRKFQEAQKTLDRVEKALPKAEQRVSVRYLLERGRTLSSSGKAKEAQPRFQEALNLALVFKMDLHAVDAAHMMAIAEPEKALEWNLKALEIAENSADQKAGRWKVILYNSLGWNYFDRKSFQEALFMFQKALEFYEQLGDPLKIRTAKWCVAKVLRAIDHVEEALEMQRGLFEEYQADGKRNGYVYEEIAECLLVVGQEHEASEWFAAAYAELSKDPRVARDQNRLNRLKELGQVGKPRPASA
ncbi:MAG TPA: tetratricopeptide repeat protein [Candidatus Sulfotelmatobacter sp.]|jgi:tetratricopeptide (TPR) repeat protein|nr:tetratricopeptide repeat protein [Candidatus Sulfotelmatobacter sp.]